VVYVLCLMQAAFVLLGGLGEVLLMGGNPGYLVLPLAKAVVLFVLAAKVVSVRRWAMIALVVVQSMTIFGFWIQVAAGALPWVDYTVNLVGLITNLALPGTLIYLCIAMFVRTRRGAPPVTAALPVAAHPYTHATQPQGPAYPQPYPYQTGVTR